MKGKEKLENRLKELGYENLEIRRMEREVPTGEAAARELAFDESEIANSLVFLGRKTNTPVLVISSSINRVDSKKIKKDFGESIKMADPDQVLEFTGYRVGGVAPVGENKNLKVYIDEDLLEKDIIWAGGGEVNTLLKLTPEILVEITKGKVMCTKR